MFVQLSMSPHPRVGAAEPPTRCSLDGWWIWVAPPRNCITFQACGTGLFTGSPKDLGIHGVSPMTRASKEAAMLIGHWPHPIHHRGRGAHNPAEPWHTCSTSHRLVAHSVTRVASRHKTTQPSVLSHPVRAAGRTPSSRNSLADWVETKVHCCCHAVHPRCFSPHHS